MRRDGMHENVARQFSWNSVWDRLGRAVIGSIAYTTGTGGIPTTELEWLGLAGVIAACIWTGKGDK